MVRSTSPELPLVLMLPLGNPSVMGVPVAAVTVSSALARATATLYGSEDLSAADTPEKMAKMLKPNTATARMRQSKVPRQQPVGTNHFQLRLHHPGTGCPCIAASTRAFSTLKPGGVEHFLAFRCDFPLCLRKRLAKVAPYDFQIAYRSPFRARPGHRFGPRRG